MGSQVREIREDYCLFVLSCAVRGEENIVTVTKRSLLYIVPLQHRSFSACAPLNVGPARSISFAWSREAGR
ncbi:unnamed protein product [Musa hybrid cultivar]